MEEDYYVFKIDQSIDWYGKLYRELGFETQTTQINGQNILFTKADGDIGRGGACLLQLSHDILGLYLNVIYNKNIKANMVNQLGEFFVINYSISDAINFERGLSEDSKEGSSRLVTLTDAALINNFSPTPFTPIKVLRIIMSRDFAVNLAENIFVDFDINKLFNTNLNTVFLQYEMDEKSEKIISDLSQYNIYEPGFHIYLTSVCYNLLAIFQDVLKSRRKPILSKLSKEDVIMIEKSRVHMIENLEGKFPGITNLGLISCMSSSKFKILFTKIYGLAPQKYYINKKMEYAKKMLLNEDTSISIVVFKLGYQNASAFTRQFKKYFGVLPKDVKNIIV
ncbi:helix-turn-helix transcriptional regulator [Pedobacter sp. PAMC26386]|nr:helix-turn-helix transcriptional regulator [Pedobacter sp. PAMC26386]